MYSNGPFSFNQAPQSGYSQSKFNQASDMGTTFGYPMEPTGIPTQPMGGQQMVGQQMGGQQMAQMPSVGAGPVDFESLPTTPVLDTMYTQGYLKSQIGARVKVEFLIGTNMLVDREGTLVDVGISYIIIREVDTDDLLLCDIYSIKFVRFYY